MRIVCALLLGIVGLCGLKPAYAVTVDFNSTCTDCTYNAYIGEQSGLYTQRLVGIIPGQKFDAQWQSDGFMAVTAVNSNGVESGFSNEIAFTADDVATRPASPAISIITPDPPPNTSHVTITITVQ